MTKKKKIPTGLGKGLGALLPNIEFSPDKGFKVSPTEEEDTGGKMMMIETTKIHNNPYQPRQDFDPRALEDLKNSILQHGVIQPITVRREINGFELIAGERRLRAVIAAGIPKIPAYILDIDRGVEMLEIALIENLQREDLNPIETAHGYQRLIEECRLTQEQVAVKIGKDRTTITNFLRLLKLPENIQESLRQKKLSSGHARAMLALTTKSRMNAVCKKVLDNQLSVRATEQLVKDIESGAIIISDDGKQRILRKESKSEKEINEALEAIREDIEDNLRHVFGTNVKIISKSNQSGHLHIEFFSIDDLDRILELCQLISENKTPVNGTKMKIKN